MNQTLIAFITRQRAKANEAEAKEWDQILTRPIETLNDTVNSTPYDGSPRSMVHLIVSLTFWPKEIDLETELELLEWAEEERDNAEPDGRVVWEALISCLNDVAGDYIPLSRTIYAFADAYDNEKLNVPPQARIVGVDKESDTKRKALYVQIINKLKEALA